MFLILLGRGRHQDASKYIDDGARMPLSLPVTARRSAWSAGGRRRIDPEGHQVAAAA